MAKIKNYGLVEVEKFNGAVKVQIQFDNGLWYESFLLKQDGAPNVATVKTLITCGFKGQDPMELIKGPGSGVLNEQKEFDLEIEQTEWNGKTYQKVKWVNDPDRAPANKFASQVNKAKLGGAQLMKAFSEISSEMNNKNNQKKGSDFDANEEIPF